MSFENSIKITFLGDANSGKTSLINQFTYQKFDPSSFSTIGASNHIKPITISNTEFTLNIWDTAGQERFKSISKMLYRDADAVVLVFDLSSRSSYESLQGWYESVREISPQNVIILVVGNKIDYVENELSNSLKREAQLFGSRINAPVLFVSAKTGEEVEMIFDKILEIFVSTRTAIRGKSNEKNSFMLSETVPKVKKSGCC
jgi:small GTP-binding protein